MQLPITIIYCLLQECLRFSHSTDKKLIGFETYNKYRLQHKYDRDRKGNKKGTFFLVTCTIKGYYTHRNNTDLKAMIVTYI